MTAAKAARCPVVLSVSIFNIDRLARRSTIRPRYWQCPLMTWRIPIPDSLLWNKVL